MNNTLKQLQEKGEEEFDYNFDFGIEDKAVKNFINQQTTLAFEAGKAEALAMVLKEIEGAKVEDFDKETGLQFGDASAYNHALQDLKTKLTARE